MNIGGVHRYELILKKIVLIDPTTKGWDFVFKGGDTHGRNLYSRDRIRYFGRWLDSGYQ